MSLYSLKYVNKSIVALLGIVMVILVPPVVSAADNDIVASIHIQNHEPVSEKQIRDVLTLKEGDAFTEEKLEQSLSLLKDWNRFESISYEKEHTSDGWVLTFDLMPALVITGIKFTGHFPYLTSRVQRNIGLNIGEVYEREAIIDEVKKLRRFFERQGYFATTVRVKEKVNDKKGTVALKFIIRKGPRLRWRNIEVEGNKAVSTGYFRSKVNAWYPYQPSRLRKSIEKIKEHYKKKGYPRARIRVQNINRDFEAGKADLDIVVSEQSHLDIRFHGNNSVLRRNLMQAITFFREEAYDSYEVRASVESLKEYYLKRGFLDVEVKAEKKLVKPARHRIDFFIKEGPQTLVKKIRFEGSETLDESKVKKELSLKPAGFFTSGYLSRPALERDRRIIPNLLREQGYPEGELKGTSVKFTPLHDRANVEFVVHEGLQTVVRELSFTGADHADMNKLKKPLKLKPGKPYSEIAVKDDKLRIKNYYADNGYPYAEVESEANVDEENGDVNVIFHVNEGPLVTIGSILIIGIDHTRASTIRSALYVDRGDPYSRSKILRGASILRKLGSFESVKVDTIGLKEKQETVHLSVNVEERERYIFDLKASYSTDDRLTGVFALRNLDVMGFGKRMSLIATLGFDTRGGELNYIDPHLLGGDIEMVLSGFIENEDRPSFDQTSYGGSFSLLKDIGRSMSILGRYQLERTLFHGGTPDPDEDTDDRTLPHVRVSFNYDTRDYFADPRKGIFSETSLDYFHQFFGTSANFFRLRGQFNYYLSPHSRFTFVNSMRMGGAIPVTSSEVIPRSELFFIGGDYTVRGFDQDKAGPLDASGTPIGQKFMFIWNTELQLRVAGNVKLAAFLDTGTAGQSFTFTKASLRHSAGIGLRYITPVGPVRLDYGFVLDRAPDEGVGRLHFTFGYAF